jgi:hypothetical protein
MPAKITSTGTIPRQRKKTQPQTITALQQSRLVADLGKLGDPVVAAEQASSIVAAMRALQLRSSGGYDIGRDVGGFYARPREAEVRHERELNALAAIARKAVAGKADVEEWIDAWVALPASTSRRIDVVPHISKKNSRSVDPRKIYSYATSKIAMIIPRPEYALPAINAAIERIEKTRQPNTDEAAVIRAVQKAYQTLTGRPGGRVIDGPLHRLGLAIDRIFETNLFPEKDSLRLRKILGTKSRADG